MKNTFAVSLIFLSLLSGCSSKGNSNDPIGDSPLFISSDPTMGSKELTSGERTIIITYDQNITIKTPHGIKLNGNNVNQVNAIFKELKINVTLEKGKSYTLTVPDNVVKGPTGLFSKGLEVNFETKAAPSETIKKQLVTPNVTKETQNVYQFLIDNYGKNIISGTMAKVNWNIDEAERVKRWTGKYPALNGFDYIHHVHSTPGGWIDYENTKVVEDWWSNNGLVSIMWHWNVKANNGTDYAFYYGSDQNKTTFDVSKISNNSSEEYKLLIKDIDIISGYLKLLQTKNIPVIWRPLHEAAGKWFWWGAKGAEPQKALWKLMFDRMVNHHQLKNLIWVWTTETGDDDWYPGDAYVDMIGRDMYNVLVPSSINQQFEKISQKYTNKIVTLSECGSVALVSEQWKNNACWSWFMPWYDYNATDDKHEHANADFWRNAMNMSNIVNREKMPSLK